MYLDQRNMHPFFPINNLLQTGFLAGCLIIFCTTINAQLSSSTMNPAFQILKCYQCSNQRSNDNCSRSSDLKPCFSTTGFTSNVCSTKVEHRPTTGTLITKECGTGPCELDTQGSLALGGDQLCDFSKPSWVCSKCCSGDGCNISPGSRISATVASLIALYVVQLGYYINFCSL